MLKKLVLIILFIIIGAIILGGLLFWNQISLPVASSEEQEIFQIEQGEGVKEIAANLEEADLIRSAYWFEVYVYFDGSEAKFIAGEYFLSKNMNMRETVAVLTGGQVADEKEIKIREGWTAVEIADYLAEKGIVEKNEFIKEVATSDSRQLIPDQEYDFLKDKPADHGLEGYLFPDTYRIFDDSDSVDIIKKMLDNFELKYTDEMRRDTAAGNVSIYDIVTLASIIEKEVSIKLDDDGVPINNDHYIVAGIFYNRINSSVALQSDATVNYVTGKQALQPTLDDLEVDNPYNTYKYRGLPPGPICNPSLSSIMAAIYPEKSEYFYFLTKPDDSTVFSKTYSEHLENKNKYLK